MDGKCFYSQNNIRNKNISLFQILPSLSPSTNLHCLGAWTPGEMDCLRLLEGCFIDESAILRLNKYKQLDSWKQVGKGRSTVSFKCASHKKFQILQLQGCIFMLLEQNWKYSNTRCTLSLAFIFHEIRDFSSKNGAPYNQTTLVYVTQLPKVISSYHDLMYQLKDKLLS